MYVTSRHNTDKTNASVKETALYQKLIEPVYLKTDMPKIEDVEQKPQETASTETPEPTVPSECINRFVVHNKADLEKIKNCKTVVGDIEFVGYSEPLLLLQDIEVLNGSLIVRLSPDLVRIEAPNLQQISHRFVLGKLTSLSLISFPALAHVRILEWKVLPILSNVHFPGSVKGLESLVIADTSLTGVTGFSAEKLAILDINNNRFLDTILSDVQHITERLHVAANARNIAVDLPHLKTTHNMSIHDVAELNLANLEEVTGSASILNNLVSKLLLPKLHTVAGTFSLSKNKNLHKVDIPQVHEIGGGLIVANNSHLENINFFPKLAVIGGALELVGNIRETSMKSLKLVKGSARIRSYVSSFDCAKWAKNDVSSVIRGGKIECTNSDNVNFVSDTPQGEETSFLFPQKSGAAFKLYDLTKVLLAAVVFSNI